MATHGEIRWPSLGSFDGRLRGDSHGRRHHFLPGRSVSTGSGQHRVVALLRYEREPQGLWDHREGRVAVGECDGRPGETPDFRQLRPAALSLTSLTSTIGLPQIPSNRDRTPFVGPPRVRGW
jgi:hypothetical protein